MRFLRRSLIGIFLLSLTVGLLTWAGNTFYGAIQVRLEQDLAGRPTRERVLAAKVALWQPRTITPVLTSFGEVRSRRTLELRATSSGTIVELAEQFEEGGSVQAGQLLARIDPGDANAALAHARTNLQEAEAELRDARRGMGLAAGELASAENQVRLREQALSRQSDLLARGVGTGAAAETAELAVSTAKQAVLARRQSLANAQARIDLANTALARRQIEVSEAQRILAKTEIFAGFAGVLAEVSVVKGGLVANNERMAQIVDANALEVSFRVSIPQYARLLDDSGKLLLSELRISVDIFGVDLSTSGTITRESAIVGEGQTGRLLFAKIGNPKGFRPGDFVTVEIDEPPLDRVVLLPASAVDSSPSVLVVGLEDRLELIPIELLHRQGDNVIVRARGLAGRQVVSERSPLLGAGIRIKPILAGAAESSLAVVEQDEPEMIGLSIEKRAELVAFIEGNKRMPAGAKERILGQLKQELVPVEVVKRIESRMGG